MNCQRCNSDRLVTIGGKTSDMFNMSYEGMEMDGYVPTDLFFGEGGYGDYFTLIFCAECGQTQAKFPIAQKKIEKAWDQIAAITDRGS